MQPADLLPAAGRGNSPANPGVGRAHGKAILLGEHAVVYGAPALVVPIPQLTATATATRRPGTGADSGRITFAMVGPGSAAVTPLATDGLRHLVTEFEKLAGLPGPLHTEVVIESSIPQGRGLGSSAACARAAALALADACGHRIRPSDVYDLVQSSEMVAHGRASGIDAVATGATGALMFRSGTAQELPEGAAEHPDAAFVIADSGIGGSTKAAVELLAGRFDHEPALREDFVTGVTDLMTAAVHELVHGDLAGFGSRLTENHRLLREIGISTARIDALVEAALAAGALGAKITGGGLGGCLIALAADAAGAAAVGRALRAAGAVTTWVVPMTRAAGHDD
ncbi:mevalonate kinase [Actinoplanes sp. RD1]|uniref:mevalonate kinase n=1 Tax=Actinoplanes sp. RD1 TaxID=3064538 RepID=UPI002740CA3D|nr:mevalonate kinase [Actinoplanes sp. RD1]